MRTRHRPETVVMEPSRCDARPTRQVTPSPPPRPCRNGSRRAKASSTPAAGRESADRFIVRRPQYARRPSRCPIDGELAQGRRKDLCSPARLRLCARIRSTPLRARAARPRPDRRRQGSGVRRAPWCRRVWPGRRAGVQVRAEARARRFDPDRELTPGSWRSGSANDHSVPDLHGPVAWRAIPSVAVRRRSWASPPLPLLQRRAPEAGGTRPRPRGPRQPPRSPAAAQRRARAAAQGLRRLAHPDRDGARVPERIGDPHGVALVGGRSGAIRAGRRVDGRTRAVHVQRPATKRASVPRPALGRQVRHLRIAGPAGACPGAGVTP
jgi:hypothetical protein